MSWPSLSSDWPHALGLVPQPNSALGLWGLGLEIPAPLLVTGDLFGIVQDPRPRAVSYCSPKGKVSFSHPSLNHTMASCALGLKGYAVPPSAV